MDLTHPSNRQLTEWRKLLQGKYRKREKKFLAEGIRCVEQIIAQDQIRVEAVMIETGFELTNPIKSRDIQVYEVASDNFNSLSDTDTPQGVLAICHTPDQATVDSLLQKEGLIVAVDAIQDPGNLGTIIRTAAWFDTAALLIGHGTVDPFHPKVVRSTAGATGALPYVKAGLPETLRRFETSGWNIAALDGGEESTTLKAVKPSKKDILIVGNEGNGVNRELLNNRTKIRIDGNSTNVESLNAAIALSIALYQFSK